METGFAGGARSATGSFDLGAALQAAEKAAQLVDFVPEHFVGIGNDRLYAPIAAFNLAPPLMPVESSKNPSLGRRSRTENPMTLLSGNLHQHQRVHDTDEAMMVHDPVNRFNDFFDPDQSVAFQSGVHERAQDWRDDPRRRRTLFRRALKAAKAGQDEGSSSEDIISLVVGIFRITLPYTIHRVLGQTQRNRVPREIQVFLLALLRTLSAMQARSRRIPRRALPGPERAR